MGKHIIYNGEIIKNKNVYNTDHPLISGETTYRFTSYVLSSRLPLCEQHLKKIKKHAMAKGLDLPHFMNADLLAQEIFHLFQINRIYQGGYLDMIFFYNQDENKTDYIINADSLDFQKFVLNEEGFLIDIYRKHKIFSGSAEVYDRGFSSTEKVAKLSINNNLPEQKIILNENSHVARFIGANILIVNDGDVYLPDLDEGVMDDVLRDITTEACISMGLKVLNDCIISPLDIKTASEILIIHPVYGLKWVVGFENKRFYRNTIIKINQKVNELYFG